MVYEGYIGGQTEQELVGAARAKLLPLIQSYLPLADNDVLVEYGGLIAEQYAALYQVDPKLCYFYASGAGDNSFVSQIPPALIQREAMLQGRIIDTAVDRPRVSSKVTAPLCQKAGQHIDVDLEILSEPKLTPNMYGRYCETSIAFMKAIIRLPTNEAGLLLRELWGEAFKGIAKR